MGSFVFVGPSGVGKTYLALVEGRLSAPNGLIDAPIGRDPEERKRMAETVIEQARALDVPVHTLIRLGRDVADVVRKTCAEVDVMLKSL